MSRPTGVARSVIAWQRRHGRHALPWQNTRDPYRVWLSEIMLQQTQVATVLDYYARFIARFPDLQTLAAAPLDDVLARWSGLGYYSRARNLHRCAQIVVAEFGGQFPRSSAGLAMLPGIGRSTAAAIAVFCFGERAAILDGNVKRVLTRVLGDARDLSLAANERALWAIADDLLPARGIERYTQGLMDLGATLCTARAPACNACPLAAICVARGEGAPERYPVRSRRGARGRRENWWLWLQWRDRVWLQQRPARGVWAGLWTLPLLDDEGAADAIAARLGVALEPLPAIEHALTHFDWSLHPRRARLARKPGAPLPGPGRWVERSALANLALPAPLRRLLG
ncbi:MAG TPA: A/G-specific adenine glycosylase [Burkholderiaceae bacterium]|nr:A/G-specific adenine glycosylase [Burkholderiaceae bacterium]